METLYFFGIDAATSKGDGRAYAKATYYDKNGKIVGTSQGNNASAYIASTYYDANGKLLGTSKGTGLNHAEVSYYDANGIFIGSARGNEGTNYVAASYFDVNGKLLGTSEGTGGSFTDIKYNFTISAESYLKQQIAHKKERDDYIQKVFFQYKALANKKVYVDNTLALNYEELKKMADTGNEDAQVQLGSAMKSGSLGLKISKEEGNKYLILASNKINTPAGKYAKGVCCLEGIGVSKNEVMGNQYIEKQWNKDMFQQFIIWHTN